MVTERGLSAAKFWRIPLNQQMNTPDEPTIRLDQFLKLTGLVGTGGQAKQVIQSGEVFVNGEPEVRRSRKLRKGDIVTWDDQTFEVDGG